MSYEQIKTNTNSKRDGPIQENSNKHRLITHYLGINFHSFLNFDKQTQT